MRQKTTLSGQIWVKLGVIFFIALIISIYSYFPVQVEMIYSNGLYPAIGTTLRIFTRWIPFSIGDVLYIWAAVSLCISLVKMVLRVLRKQFSRERWVHWLLGFAGKVCWVYVIFKLLWGLNYNRLGIEYQLKLTKNACTKEEVLQLADILIDSMNACRKRIADTALPVQPIDTIFRKAFRSYQNLSLQYDFLNYRNRSVKRSLFTPVADYLNFTGYYNPFTGEAQVRTDVPSILLPYVTCHEMAHQLGYANESEANFVGYLAAVSSKDVFFRYSVYLDLFSYTQGEEIRLFLLGKENNFHSFDSIMKHNRAALDTLVKKDRKEIRAFFLKRNNKFSPAVSSLYDQYLKLNKQKEGINSYNEVVAWLISYRKKYGLL